MIKCKTCAEGLYCKYCFIKMLEDKVNCANCSSYISNKIKCFKHKQQHDIIVDGVYTSILVNKSQ